MLQKPESRLALVVLAFAVSITVFVFEPLKGAIANWDEIGIGSSMLAQQLALPWLVAFAALALVALAVGFAAPSRGVAWGVTVYLLLWLQANVLVWDYPEFDGSSIAWEDYTGRAVLELALWLGALAIATFRPSWFARRWGRWCAVIAALQFASLAGHWLENAPLSEKPPVVDDSGIDVLTGYSADRNVVVIVLDGHQSDFFATSLEDPDFQQAIPPGFTYHRNAVSLYVHTEFSLQTMLTSRAVPDGVDYEDWGERALADSIVARLERDGFQSSFLTGAGRVLLCGRAGIECIEPSELARGSGSFSVRARTERDVDAMFRLGLFRLAPHVLKRFVYDAGVWRVPSLYRAGSPGEIDERIVPETRDDLRILRRLAVEARLGGPPRFKFLHFRGAHFPATVARDCTFSAQRFGERESLDKARGRLVEQGECIATRLFAYLNELDRIGAYDPSLIFIVSDHGSPIVPVAPELARPPIPPARAAGPSPLANPWAGLPLFLVKQPGDRHGLHATDAPVSLCDVPGSIADALEMGGDFACPSVFAPPVRGRVRSHYRYPSRGERRAAGLAQDKRVDFTHYQVRGHSWRPEAWQAAPAETARDVPNR